MLPSVRTSHPIDRPCPQRGLTLLESLIAIALLVVVVTAVLGAMEVGRQHSDEGRRLTMSSLAAEMLLARVADTYGVQLATGDDWFNHFTDSIESGGWHGHSEAKGEVRAGRDALLPLLPVDYQDFELDVKAIRMAHDIAPPLAVRIDGVHLQVRAQDALGRELITVARFLPLPQHLTQVDP
jgi:prepilin-type N-terminal cleavage/methylation domain-containing protein